MTTLSTEESQYRTAYNAHERAEQAMIKALREYLNTRSSLSPWISDNASEVLDEKLEAEDEILSRKWEGP